MHQNFKTLALSLIIGSSIGSGLATAQNNPAGSMMVFSEFDNRAGVANVITVTNTSSSESIKVEFVYIGRVINGDVEIPCAEFNRTETLTPNDTFTFLTKAHNPALEQGYVYAFAKDVDTNEPIAFDHLVGSMIKVDSIYVLDYGVNAVVFQASQNLAHGALTDVDGDGLRDMNGEEYSMVADKVVIPRFFGQAFLHVSNLHLIGLTGGTKFDTTLDFQIYNDNEEVFSAEYTFNCWDKVKLIDISALFDNLYLQNYTNHDPDEIFGFAGLESGWMRIDGAVASSTSTSIQDPAFIAVLSEGLRTLQVADLPFTEGFQDNGDLLSRAVGGDTSGN
ncbi:MAG: hypothetical protein ACI9F9_001586 [Candidatus Paceibacteria bacterium]|jgi:hypothetical protein